MQTPRNKNVGWRWKYDVNRLSLIVFCFVDFTNSNEGDNFRRGRNGNVQIWNRTGDWSLSMSRQRNSLHHIHSNRSLCLSQRCCFWYFRPSPNSKYFRISVYCQLIQYRRCCMKIMIIFNEFLLQRLMMYTRFEDEHSIGLVIYFNKWDN